MARDGRLRAGLLEAQKEGATLLTDDSDLYVASVTAGYAAINVNHLWEDDDAGR